MADMFFVAETSIVLYAQTAKPETEEKMAVWQDVGVIWEHTSTFLHAPDFFSLARTCQTCREVAKTVPMETLRLPQRTMSNKRMPTDDLLKMYAQWHRLTFVDVSGTVDLTDEGVANLLGLPLTDLNLSSSGRLTDAALVRLSESKMPLRKLGLSFCRRISDVGLAHLQVRHHRFHVYFLL